MREVPALVVCPHGHVTTGTVRDTGVDDMEPEPGRRGRAGADRHPGRRGLEDLPCHRGRIGRHPERCHRMIGRREHQRAAERAAVAQRDDPVYGAIEHAERPRWREQPVGRVVRRHNGVLVGCPQM